MDVKEQEFILCDICGSRIYLEDDRYDGDGYYAIDGYNICQDCLRDYMKENYGMR